MPRTYGKSKGKAKQTRLAFVPAEFASDDKDDESSRKANVRYTRPSMSTVRRGRSAGEKSSAPKPFVTVEPSPEESSQSEVGKSTKMRPRSEKRGSSRKPISNTATPSAPPSPLTATQDSESDLDIVHSARKPMRTRALKRRRPVDSSGSEEQKSEESDVDEIISRPRRKLRRGGVPQLIVVDDDSSDEEIRIVASRTPSVPHTPRRDSAQDRIDLEEDLEDLQDSVVRTSRTRGNIANSARAQRQLHLEALRRRRAGQKEEEDEEYQLSPQPEAPGSEDNEEELKDEEAPVRQPAFRNWADQSDGSDVESTIGANDDLDRYEDDFVLDDEDDKLGAPTSLEDIPIEFSRHSYKQLKDYFQDAVEWMVHNQLNPAFPRSDPVYRVAFDKLEQEVRGRTGSQLVSSVWSTDFRRALLARPQLEVTKFPTEFQHPCDACNRSGHPASFDIKLYGKAYSLETLEPLADADADSDEEQSGSEEDSDGKERDRDGYVLADEDKRFYLGRHCMKNAGMAHTLTHWRFHLNEWVVEHLRTTGYMSDRKIIKRSHMSQKKKNKHAAKAFTKMVESGEVMTLWRDFHINLRTARESTTL